MHFALTIALSNRSFFKDISIYIPLVILWVQDLSLVVYAMGSALNSLISVDEVNIFLY